MALRALQGPTGGGTPVGGSGTSSPSTIPRWTGPSTLGDSQLKDNGTLVGIGASLTSGNRLVIGGVASGTSFIKANEATFQIGNIFAGPVQILTSDTPQVTVTGAGNVGIGTPSPGDRLQIGAPTGAAPFGIIIGENYGAASQRARLAFGDANRGIGLTSGDNVLIHTFNTNSILFGHGSTTSFTERARIDSAGRLLVGTSASPGISSVREVLASSGSAYLVCQNTASNVGGAVGAASAAGLEFYAVSGALGAESYTLSAKATSTGLDVSTSGYGLKLPATPGNTDPNTLDAYVDGGTPGSGGATFTATLKGSTTDPTTPVTTTGKYVLVGKVLTMSIYFDNVNTTGASGDVIIETNLAAALRPQMRSVGQVGIYNFNAVGLGTFADARTDGKIYIMCNQNNNVWTAATHSAGAGRYLLVTVTFIIG